MVTGDVVTTSPCYCLYVFTISITSYTYISRNKSKLIKKQVSRDNPTKPTFSSSLFNSPHTIICFYSSCTHPKWI